jgi:cytochrome P450
VALTIVWALHFLSTHPEAQARLREEVLSVPMYSPSQVSGDEELVSLFNEIDSLPFLDMVLKETLRLSPSVHSTVRVAMVDDEIPLSEAMVMRDGSVQTVCKVKKGQWIHIPLEASNTDRAIWGDDAWDFK